jgi:hypothetical protein
MVAAIDPKRHGGSVSRRYLITATLRMRSMKCNADPGKSGHHQSDYGRFRNREPANFATVERRSLDLEIIATFFK